MSLLTPFSDYRQKHPEETERFAPPIVEPLAKTGQILVLPRVFAGPASFEILENGSGRTSSYVQNYLGELCFNELLNRFLDFIGIDLAEGQGDLSGGSKRLTLPIKDRFCKFFREGLRPLDSLFPKLF